MDYGKEDEGNDANETFKSSQKESIWTLLGALILIASIIGGSSIGPISNFLPPESSFVKNSWRYGILAIFFVIPATIEFFITRKKQKGG